MKFFVLALLAFAALAQGETDWSKIKPKHMTVQPIRPAPRPKIVGGEEVEGVGGLSFQAAVIAGGFCGGSIIRSNVVLTAAHCVDGVKSATAIVGAHYIQEEEDTQQIFTSTNIIVHEDWDSWSIANDIALVILPSHIEIGPTAYAVPLNDEFSFLDGRDAAVSGWGRPSDSSGSLSPVLLFAMEKIISNRECASYFGSYIKDTNVCLDGSNGKGSCNGDSGGPLVIYGERLAQVGIVSFGSAAGCEAGYPSVYTRVYEYIDWINKNLVSSATVTAGAHYIQQNEETQQIVRSSKIIVHEDWDSWSISDDIALVILSSDLNLDGSTAAAVALNEESSSLDGEEAIVSGWGRPSDSTGSISPVLRYVVENIISNRECEWYFGSYIRKTNVCLDGANGKGSCNGDSGGALCIVRDDKPVQAGIVSFGSGAGCEAGYPSAYTRVSEYIDWINKNLP